MRLSNMLVNKFFADLKKEEEGDGGRGQNQIILEKNRTDGKETLLNHAAREGKALLQKLLLCGSCTHKRTVRCKGNGGVYPIYECSHRKREGLSSRGCMSVWADLLDRAISKKVLEVVKPEQIKIALSAIEELERREKPIDNQWRMKIERAEYEAQLAQRRYEEVDPSNRLVAATLESRWNEALLKAEQIKGEFFEYQMKRTFNITSIQKDTLLALAKDLPRLWNSPTTKDKDRKRLLRLLIKDITVERHAELRNVILHIRWHGGTCEDIKVDLPPKLCNRLRYPKEIVEKIRNLSGTLMDQIAEQLRKEGILSGKGKPFTKAMIKWIRYKHSIPSVQLKHPEELRVKQVAERFKVSIHVIYYWIERKLLYVRKINKFMPYWITLDSQKEEELRWKVFQSSKIRKDRIEEGERVLQEV